MMIPFKQNLMHLSASSSDEHYLIGSRCRSCGAVAFPKRKVCHKCHKDAVEEMPLGKRGKLASFVVAWAVPEGFEPPMMLGYIDMPEGVRLLSMITGCKASYNALDLGQEMGLVFEPIRTDEAGNQVMAFKFKPIMEGGESS
jgi:uncharacterized OB-fold protein